MTTSVPNRRMVAAEATAYFRHSSGAATPTTRAVAKKVANVKSPSWKANDIVLAVVSLNSHNNHPMRTPDSLETSKKARISIATRLCTL